MKKNNEPHMNKEKGKRKRHGVITYPDTIGPYTIKNTIGEGAFSIVKLAYHELYYQYYACKIVPIRMLEKGDLKERFELEIRISQLLRHPGVAAITDVLKDDNNFYVFLEYYPNGNLLKYIIKKSKLKENEAKGLMYQLLDALEYIHNQGVTHRDLKPENIIIDNNGHIRISDFGLSQFVDNNNLVKTACGSPCYVSPEVISGLKYDGFKSDMWSCGVILYAMVTGLLPWTKKEIKEIFTQIRNGDYKIPHYVSDQCANLIQMLLTVDPNKRITLDEAKHHTWFNIKSKQDEQDLLTYSIPAKYLRKSVNSNLEHAYQIPYLSTRKVDIYFRPDIDFDFDNQFNNIENIHAISNSARVDSCESSSPYLKFSEALKFLQAPQNSSVKFRKRLASQANKNENLDLDQTSYLQMQSLSTGEIVLSKTIFADVDSTKMNKEKSEVIFKDKSVATCTKNNNHKENYTKRHRKSAGLPKRFEANLKHN